MTDSRPPSDPRPDHPVVEAIEAAVGKVMTGLVIAGAIVGLAVYARPGPPRFEAFADGDRIVRIDTRKGTIISCEGERTCQFVLRRGQRVNPIKRTDAPALPRPATRAIPAPAAPAAEK
jgi:hypothetical protein